MAASPHMSAPSPWRSTPLRRVARLTLALGLTAALLSLAPIAAAQPHTAYHQTNQVSDVPGLAALTDPNLVNAWGLAAGPTPIWSNDNGTDVATVYSGAVNGSAPAALPIVVHIPGGAPTGIVFNGQPGFTVSAGGVTAPARFIFVTEAGTLSGWAPNVPLNGEAQLKATVPGAIHKGLATLTNDQSSFLYAANFSDARIDVFDSNWNNVQLSGDFTDSQIPRGFAPFNVQALAGKLYVAYAKQDPERSDEVAGPGLGFVDVFDSTGHLLRRLIRRGHLNAPWGLVIAPEGFGQFSGDLVVGNFGDGGIHAYDPATGAFRGALRDENGNPIVIDGLWALRAGNGIFGDPTDLVFSAGPEDETHGLLGTLKAVSG